MFREMVPALKLTVATLILTGVVYPLAMTGVAQVIFPRAADGALIEHEGRVVGSALIGQATSRPEYFQPRPSAAGNGYDAAASSGSNLGATSAKLRDRAKADVERLETENPQAAGPVPAELATASASGLDPHVSPAAARWQAPRVARARGVALSQIESLVAERTEGRTFGVLGEPRVNVLLLNLALDDRFGAPPAK